MFLCFQVFLLEYSAFFVSFLQSLEDFGDDEDYDDDRGYEEDNEDDQDYLEYKDERKVPEKKESGK